jgi:hypothetical protein
MEKKEYDQIKVGDMILLHKECESNISASPLRKNNLSSKVVKVIEKIGGVDRDKISKILIIDSTERTYTGLICTKCVKFKL